MITRALRVLQRSIPLGWSAFVLLLPFTSLPLVALLLRTDTVAAPAAFPITWLFLVWFLPAVWRGRRLGGQVRPFLAFLVIAGLASARSFFIEIPPLRGRTPAGEMLDALITLAAAVIVYLVVSAYPKNERRLRHTLRLVNWGGAVLVGWSMLQIVFILGFEGDYPAWMKTLQSWFSLRRLFEDRITGFAFEPSWLAHQLNLLYLPYWLAASLTGYSAHRRLRISFENLLLGGGLLALLLSFSRVGWAAFGLVITYLLVRGTLITGRRLFASLESRVRLRAGGRWMARAALLALVSLCFALLYAAAGFAFYRLAGQFDPRIGNIDNRLEQGVSSFYQLTNRLAFAERSVLWGAGWEIFNDYPLLGVGLGNSGFFIPEKMPAFGWLLVEINNILYRRSFLPNVKNLWARLLAETGILGLAVFAVWLVVIWRDTHNPARPDSPLLRCLNWMARFVLLGLLLEGFSVDSFGLPYLWFSLGLATAAGALQSAARPASAAQEATPASAAGG